MFVARLRKLLKTRRVTSVAQIGTDRVLEFQFGDGQYFLYLEFFAAGNIVVTDGERKILALLRPVSAGDGQEELRVGLTYRLDNRQNYHGVPDLTIERLRVSLQRAVDRNTGSAVPATSAKKLKTKPGDELRKALAVSINEYPPVLLDHAMTVTGFDPTIKPAELLEAPALLESLLQSLQEAKRVVKDITSSSTANGYIIASRKAPESESTSNERSALIYEDLHPFKPRQLESDPRLVFLEFAGYNIAVDEFFSSVEGQKLESRLEEREMHAKRKLEAARNEHSKRLGGLQAEQAANEEKAAAITCNVERVQEAIDAVNGLVAQGMDWVEIGKLIEVEQSKHNPVASMIRLPLKLNENTITLQLTGEDLDDVDSAYETDSTASESEEEETVEVKRPAHLNVDINLALSPWANAREYFDQKRVASKKEEKTLQASSKALKSTEQKINRDLQRGLKHEKAVLRPVRKQQWFEKYIWFISSDGYLVLAGKDALQSELLYKRYFKRGDVYVFADFKGASPVIVRNKVQDANAPIPPSTLSQAGTLTVSLSAAWDSKAGASPWWVSASQVSKSALTGGFLPVGEFGVTGEKHFLPPAQLLMGFGVMFLLSPESKARHLKHRTGDDQNVGGSHQEDIPSDNGSEGQQSEDSPSDINKGGPVTTEQDDTTSNMAVEQTAKNDEKVEDDSDEASTRSMTKLAISNRDEDIPAEDDRSEIAASEAATEEVPEAKFVTKGPAPPKRGQKAKAKKIARKYKDQDEEDRRAAQELIGAATGAKRATIAAETEAQREAELAFHMERRRAQHNKQQKDIAQHEMEREKMLEDGHDAIEEDDVESSTPIDALVGTPLPGDDILDAIPVCAPWLAMGKLKYKAKLQPGPVKKGKAVREVLGKWLADASIKGKIDETANDTELMWPREVQLLKSWRAEEIVNTVPVGKVKVMMAGSAASQGSAGKQGKGGNRGGRGSKKR